MFFIRLLHPFCCKKERNFMKKKCVNYIRFYKCMKILVTVSIEYERLDYIYVEKFQLNSI